MGIGGIFNKDLSVTRQDGVGFIYLPASIMHATVYFKALMFKGEVRLVHREANKAKVAVK